MKTSLKKKPQIQGIILAAGRGRRMNATVKNKVMYEVRGKPMITYPIEAMKGLGITRPIIVVGFAREGLMEYLKGSVEFAIQKKVDGTADAVRTAMPHISQMVEQVIVLYGDHSTFYTTSVLQQLLDHQKSTGAAMTLITTDTNPKGYGRILRDDNGKMIGIVEEMNATDEQQKITEINTGNAVYSMPFLQKYLPMIHRNPASGEFYFTDIVALGFQHNEKIETLVLKDKTIGIGINTPEQLAVAEEVMKKKQL